MTASVRRRTSLSRALVALGAVALLALVAVAAIVFGGSLGERSAPTGTEAHTAAAVSGEHDLAVVGVHAFRQQPSTRARSVAFAVLASVAIAAAWMCCRLRLVPAGRLRTLRISGLPPGRAPPALRIA
jgi:cytochrome b